MITNIADAGNECALGHLATTKLRSTRTETPDAALINRIVAGDKHAMQVLYSRHNLSVFRFVLRFLRDEAAAEDVVHEVFIDVWRRAGNFENQSRVSTWLLAIARNKAFVAL